jgi:hypothetical protein
MLDCFYAYISDNNKLNKFLFSDDFYNSYLTTLNNGEMLKSFAELGGIIKVYGFEGSKKNSKYQPSTPTPLNIRSAKFLPKLKINCKAATPCARCSM